MKMLYFLLAGSMLVACSLKQRSPLLQVTDPMASAFWNKNLKRAIIKPCVDSTCTDFVKDFQGVAYADTLTFDREGNIIKRDFYNIRHEFAFDKRRFVTRTLLTSDTYTYELSKYEEIPGRPNILIRKKYPLKYSSTLNETFQVQDTSKYLVDTLVFKANGQISHEIKSDQSIIEFEYKGQKLVKRAFSSEGEIYRTVVYTYGDKNLSQVVTSMDGYVETISYSSEGLPENKIESRGGELQYWIYDYVYY